MARRELLDNEKDYRKKIILDAANAIIITDGIEGFSIRQIAAMIEYSPAMIYHYFENKEDIIKHLIIEKRVEILNFLYIGNFCDASPIELLKKYCLSYIQLSLTKKEEFRAFMLHHSKEISAHTGMLHEGATDVRPGLKVARETIRAIMDNGTYDEKQLELITQVAWTALFGLITRVILEDISEERQRILIDQMIDLLVSGLQKIAKA